MRTLVDRRIILTLLVFLVAGAAVASGSCDTALLVIDVQNMFLEPGAAFEFYPWVTATGQGIVPALEEIIDDARSAGVEIIYIRDISLDPDEVDQEGVAVAPEIAPLEGDAVFTKLQGNSFTNRALGEYLEAKGIQRLLFSGIASDGCVQATLCGAYRLGYDVVVVTDGHAARGGDPVTAEQRNSYWLGRGIAGWSRAEMDWDSFNCPESNSEASP